MRSYLIKIEEKSLPFIALPEQFRVRLGQTVLAIGSSEGSDHTVPKGIVSAVGRQPERDRPWCTYRRPPHGFVAEIQRFRISAWQRCAHADGSFAWDQTVKLSIDPVDASVGIDTLADLVDPQNGLVADLGIFIVDLDKRIASELPDLRSQSGVVVAAVLDYEPPISAELAAGDVIRSFNGQSLSTVGELRKNLKKLKPSDAAVLEVERQAVVRFAAFEME
jgi:S1-C subfamily serine protease